MVIGRYDIFLLGFQIYKAFISLENYSKVAQLDIMDFNKIDFFTFFYYMAEMSILR